MKPEIISNYRCQVGEGPLWHPLEKRLYWVDIPQGRVFRFDPAAKEVEICYEGEAVSGLTVQEDGSLLLFLQRGAVASWRNGKLKFIINQIPDKRAHGFNDMIADPMGRVFWGSLPANEYVKERYCGLYRIDPDGSITCVAEDIGLSNGLGFAPGCKQIYYTDTILRRIYLFDYDQMTGNLANRRVFVETGADDGDPDGMTVDAQGYVWAALWGSHSVVRYTPQGIEERRIQFPAKKISSVCFGGEDFTDLYVTSAIAGPWGVDESDAAGALFRVNPGIPGIPEFFSRIGL
jgi:D-xylonolactonase